MAEELGKLIEKTFSIRDGGHGFSIDCPPWGARDPIAEAVANRLSGLGLFTEKEKARALLGKPFTIAQTAAVTTTALTSVAPAMPRSNDQTPKIPTYTLIDAEGLRLGPKSCPTTGQIRQREQDSHRRSK